MCLYDICDRFEAIFNDFCIMFFLPFQEWHPSNKAMNRAAHSTNGNTSPKSRLSESQRAVLYGAYRQGYCAGKYGWSKRIIDICAKSNPPLCPRRATVKRWVDKWQSEGGAIMLKESSRKYNAMKLSNSGYYKLKHIIKGSNQRRISREHDFDGKGGRGMVKVSKTTVGRWATKFGLVLSEPVNRRIRKHTPHHLRFRTFIGNYFAHKPTSVGTDQLVADEFGVPITLSPNKKNDVMYCNKGEQATTNIFLHTKSDDRNAFSAFIACHKNGILCTRMYTEKFDVSLFRDVLQKTVAPALALYLSAGNEFSYFIHDHVTNSSDLYDVTVMDGVFGPGKWLQHAPKICREFRGKISKVAATETRRAYVRNLNEPKLVCDCEMKEIVYCSASPDMNVGENVIGEIKRRLWIACREKKIVWKGSVKNKMTLLQVVIDELDNDKEYFAKLFGSITKRYRWIGEHNGAVYDA